MKKALLALLVGFTLSSADAVAQDQAATDTTPTGTVPPRCRCLDLRRDSSSRKPRGVTPISRGSGRVSTWWACRCSGRRGSERATSSRKKSSSSAPREIKSEEESLLAEIDVFTADVTTPCAIRCPTSPTPHWQETGKPSRQASLIIDPPDGRQPPLSPEGQARQAQQQAEAKARIARLQGREADSLSRSQPL